MRPFISMCAFAALANCAKADIDSAQEQLGLDKYLKGIVVHNPTAVIGQGEKQVKTPWMIVKPDGKSGFANDFTTNAISVVSEDGVNYYAHVEGENGDRTKVIHFTVNENGIPSKHGDVIDTTNSGETNNAEEMKKRKLIGIKDGYLLFYHTDQYGIPLIYNPENGNILAEDVSSKKKYLASCLNSSLAFCILFKEQSVNNNGTNEYKTLLKRFQRGTFKGNKEFSTISDSTANLAKYDGYYTGNSEGDVNCDETPRAKLPGPISGLSFNAQEVFATTPATNAFYNVTLGQYNVARDDYGNPKPMVPKTNDGLIKIIDNRRNGGKFLCVTTKGIIAVDD